MTMADTIAVMNAGRVEQLGHPADLYENPATVFVANFLGQSNLIRARVTGSAGSDLLLEVGGRRLAMPRARSRSSAEELFVGVRPEKIHISYAGADPGGPEPGNALDGVVTDSSFIGVSTQYLVKVPWGQELVVFASNLRLDERLRPGAPVRLSWAPEHTFGLEAAVDIAAGAQVDPELPQQPQPAGAGR